jgi:hypothetical protein
MYCPRSFQLFTYCSIAKRRPVWTETVWIVHDLLLFLGYSFSYERHLDASVSKSLRKGAVFGTFVGWMYFTYYLIYSTGFIFGSLLKQHEHPDKLTISDILVVSCSIIMNWKCSCSDLTQVLIGFAQGVSLIGFMGPFLQTYAESRAAVAPVFRLMDEVDLLYTSDPLSISEFQI